MNSVQENKNELEAAVRYCESAISRAKATIESMEFRQQAATKEWHERTGREEALQREVAELHKIRKELQDRIDDLMLKDEERNINMALMTDEIEELKSELEELSKAYKDSTHEEITMKKAWREQRELVALRDDQIAMLERRLAKKENPYPFEEGDIYYVFNQLDGTWIESVWDDESERIHDSPSIPSHPHRVYFTVDQKNVLDKFKPEQI
jgi:chromosome segregation ATPase